MNKKLMSVLLAVSLFVGIAVPTVLAQDEPVATAVPISAEVPTVAAITNSSLKEDTLYHEGARTFEPYSTALGGGWYTGVVDDNNVMVTVATDGNNKTFDVTVPLALEAGTLLTDTALKEAQKISETMAGDPLNNANTAGIALGFQLALPQTIGSDSDAIDFTKTTLSYNSATENKRIRFGTNDAKRSKTVGLLKDDDSTLENLTSVKTVVMYADAISFTPKTGSETQGKDFKVIDAPATRKYVYTFKDSSSEELAIYTINITTTPKAADPVDPAPTPTTKKVDVVGHSDLTADTLYHEGAHTADSSKLGGNWYTGLADEANVKATVTTKGKNKTFDVVVPLNYEAGAALTGDAAKQAEISLKKMGALNDDQTVDLTLGFQLALPTTIDNKTPDYKKTTLSRTIDGANDALGIYFGTDNADRADIAATDTLGDKKALTAVMYANAIAFTNGATDVEDTDFKVILAESKRTYVYTFKDESGSTLATYTINITTTPKAKTPVTVKPITFSVVAKNGQQADGNSELKYQANPDLGFGLDSVVTSDKITVNGSTTAERLEAQPDKAAFVTYFQVPGMVKADVSKVRVTRDGKVLSTDAIDSGAIAPEDKGASPHLHFKLGTMFAEKTDNTWAMKYTDPFTETVELLNAKGEVIASTTYTVDLTSAIIGTKSDEVIVTPPTIGSGVVAEDIPNSVVIPDEKKVIDDIKADKGIKDVDGAVIKTDDAKKVELKVEGISTASTDATVKADKAKIEATPELKKEGAKAAFLDITLEVTLADNNTTKLVSDLGSSKIEVVVAIPANLLAVANAEYNVFTVHKGIMTKVPSSLQGTTSIKFTANKFSTFAIVATPKATIPPIIPPKPPVEPSIPTVTPPATNNGSYSGGGGSSYSNSYDTRPTYGSVTTITDKTAIGVALIFPIGIRGITDPSFTVSEITSVEDEFKVFRALAQGYDVLSVFDINLYDGNNKVRFIDGGSITVSLPYEKGKAGVSYKILRNNEDGTVTQLPATFNGGIISFETNRFSKFAVAVTSGTVIPNDVTTPAPTPTPVPTPTPAPSANPGTGDSTPIGLIAVLLAAGAAMLVISKKVRA